MKKKLGDYPIEPALVVLVILALYALPVIAIFKLWHAAKACLGVP